MNNRILILIVFIAFGCKNSNSQEKKGKSSSHALNIIQIEEYLNNQAKKDSLHGVVLIADKDQILLKKAFGYKDLESSKKHSVDSSIGLASMSKMFTAISIMELKSQNKIDLDASLGNYLPKIENGFLKDSITVRELLSHTGGVGNYWGFTSDSEQNDFDTLYKLILKKVSIKDHGNFQYSNSDYIILGKIIESISKMSYTAYVENNILRPLEMNNTSVGLPDGGSNSTVDDLFKFSRALRNNQLLPKELIEEMRSKQSNANYGLGFQLNFKGESKIYGHPGGYYLDNTTLGVASALDIIDDRYTVIVLTNRNPGMGGSSVRNFLLDYIASKKI
ncbi:serine hydrolase domain-containing protein [Salegentibacter sp. UBA1130]|uniref:serine hydrolase domain-containing protein n=1 Tax=Salegentibacter sp. UBA1130 TaxID=1947451 RepID=UPI002579C727|nr:serine hydrolase domain-containing protein [Salegentibacter sp. UBA1130]